MERQNLESCIYPVSFGNRGVLDLDSTPAICVRNPWSRASRGLSRSPAHKRKPLLYRRWSKSASRHSTIWGWGDRKYMASMVGFGSLCSSMLSMSVAMFLARGSGRRESGGERGGERRGEEGRGGQRGAVLAIFWLRMSSSLTVASIISFVVSSTTRTFHYFGSSKRVSVACSGRTAGRGWDKGRELADSRHLG